MSGRKVLSEIREVLLASKIFQKVEFTRPKAVTEEDVFPSCYIFEEGERAEHDKTTNSRIKAYNKYMMVSLKLNLDMSDPLEYKDIQENTERAILDDNQLWKTVLDRDLEMSAWDSNAYFDDHNFKKEGVIRLRIWYRVEC